MEGQAHAGKNDSIGDNAGWGYAWPTDHFVLLVKTCLYVSHVN